MGGERSVVILNRVAKEGPTNKVTLEQKIEGTDYMDIWGDGIPGGGNGQVQEF